MSKSYRDLLRNASSTLAEYSDTPALDANVLLRFSSKMSEVLLVSNMNDIAPESVLETFYSYIERRKNNEPIAYITGTKEFWGLDFKVNSNVLIPRPESELLIELALKKISSLGKKIDIIDLGTGSGCLSISLAKELVKLKKDFSLTAVDISDAALEVARENAKVHNCDNYIQFIKSNWFNSIDSNKKFDIIITNPPYVNRGADNLGSGIKFEPDSALYSEDKGLEDIRIIIDQLADFKNRDTLFLCEIGSEQGDFVKQLVDRIACGENSIHKDLQGLDRVLAVNFI